MRTDVSDTPGSRPTLPTIGQEVFAVLFPMGDPTIVPVFALRVATSEGPAGLPVFPFGLDGAALFSADPAPKVTP